MRVAVEELTSPAEHLAAATLLSRVWRGGPNSVASASFLTALAHSGNYVGGAFIDGVLVGAAVGVRGRGDHLWSHATGVEPGLWRQGVGWQLKTHQRSWAAKHGLTEIRWTFDPLIQRNAAFNLHQLGAAVGPYHPDFYGSMDDGINAGDATDRLEVRWSVDEPHPSPRLSLRDLPDAWVLLDHELVRHPASTPRVAAVAVPPDIETLRADDPAAAARWRLAVREALQESLTAGYVITGMTLDGFYTLELS